MTERTRIKICGISERESLNAAIEGRADLVGFVHWSQSPRHVSIAHAEELAGHLPDSILPVGLFVDEEIDMILSSPFQWIQLHGNEDESTCRRLKDAGKNIIRGFHFNPEAIQRWQACADVARLLVDGSSIGGTGEGFDHGRLAKHGSESSQLLLAGGLTPETVEAAVRQVRPWGVDVSSGVERTRGLKDPALILEFCEAVRTADRHSE